MKYFFRSLEYLKPYRLRLVISVVMVLLLAGLWGGGLGLLLPGMNILLSPGGLHGWAYSEMVKDRFDANIVRRTAPPETTIEGQPVSLVLDVVQVDPGTRLAQAGVTNGDWLVGLVDETGRENFIRADVLQRKLALDLHGDQEVRLVLYKAGSNQLRTVSVAVRNLRPHTKLLGELTRRIPEPNTKADSVPIWLGLLVIVFVITILRNFFRFMQEYLVETAVQKSLWDFREDCYNTALHLPVSYFDREGTTDTMSRFIQDCGELGQAQITLFGKTLAEPAKAVASITVALILSWKLTLIAMVAGPAAFWIIRTFARQMKKASKRMLENWSDMLAVLEETLQGIRVVKTYTMEATERKRFHKVNRGLFKQHRRMALIDAASSPSIEIIGMIFGMGAAGVAGYLVLNDRMDSLDFIAWMVALGAMFDPVRKLSKVVTRFHRGDAAAGRMYELRDRQWEKRVAGSPSLPPLAESIHIENVWFRYPGTEDWVLREVNLDVSAGESVAIVGPNGSGKTTLVSLLPRLLEVDKGRILFDENDIAEHSIRSLRRQIGVVTQETVIFHGTIFENIAYGLRRTKREKVIDAAKKAFVDEFVQGLPKGYDTMVGQRGSTLSGGQRQRIAIARAILRDPAVLIFDEALSQIDPDSERRIADAMDDFMKDRTTFMIAHRFQTVLHADKIVVVDRGRIVDVGRHEELLTRCELYEHLYKTQFMHGE
jgi:ABC-type multidrug transport system fused ATPase/permease subunit